MKIPIAREIIPFLIPSIIITVIFYFVSPYVFIAGLIFCGYLFYFFRDPIRKKIDDKDLILSPADGKVVDIDQVMEPNLFKERVWRVSIFLSIFNVHVNYAPIDGTIVYLVYKKGKFLPANSSKSAMANENNSIGLHNKKTGLKIMVRQIAGIIARRVVSDHKIDDAVSRCERIGIIKFGSRVEVYIPLNCKISVKKGDKVKGKLSILGIYDE